MISAVHSSRIDDAPTRRDGAPGLFAAPHRATAAGNAVQRHATPSGGTTPQPVPRAPLARRQDLPKARRPVGPTTPRVTAAPPVPQAAKDLLIDASRGLGRAIRSTTAADRYAAAHLAALRGAAAVLAARARPVRGRRGSAWELMTKVAPEFAEWAAFFAAGSAKRQAAEAGLTRLVTAREADDMLRQVSAFLDLVDQALAPAADGRSAAR